MVQIHLVDIRSAGLPYIRDQDSRVISMNRLDSLVVVPYVYVPLVRHDAEFFKHAVYNARDVISIYPQWVFVQVSRVHFRKAIILDFIAFLVVRVQYGY